MAKYNLEVGQVVYVQNLGGWVSARPAKLEISPATIVDLNKTSGYFILHSAMERHPDWETAHQKEKRYLRNRFRVKDLRGKSTFDNYKIWLSEDEFNQYVQELENRKQIRLQAKEKYDRLTISELKKFLEEF